VSGSSREREGLSRPKTRRLSSACRCQSPDAPTRRTGLLAPSDLADGERYQFDALMTLAIHGYDQAHSQGTLPDLIEQSPWFFSQPGLREWWSEFGRGTHSGSLRTAFEAGMQRHPPTA
jgi:hypothetical protein